MTETVTGHEQDLAMDEIYSDHEFNCRGDTISPGSVIDLAKDIETNPIGLMQRIIVQPWTHEFNPKIKYRIVAGHRRYAAFKLLKRKTIPSVVHDGLTNQQATVVNIKENLSRLDLNLLQEALAVDKMRITGMTESQVAKELDMPTKWVKDRVLLLQLPEDVQHEAAAGIIKAAHINELYQMSLKSMDKMYESVRSIKNSNGRRKIKVKLKPLMAQTKKREFRNMTDVFRVQDTCAEALGENLASKALAWVIGEIETIDLLKEIKKEIDLMGLPWSIPSEYIEEERLRQKELELQAKKILQRQEAIELEQSLAAEQSN